MAERQGLSCAGVVQVYETEHSRVQALRGLDLVAVGGSITVIVGPSGSGKSSLLRILAGIDQPTAGEVRLDGRAIESLSARRRRMMRRSEIGFIQQRPSENLTPGLSLQDQVEAAARWRGSSSDIGSLFDSLGISELAEHKPDQLSGGEQQRGGIARAVVGSPSVLLADEPTAELDLESTRTVCALLRRLAVESGSVVVISTHDPEVVSIGDHVLAMRDGAVQSETIDGREVGVIDGTGRIQLPPETLDWFVNRRASVEVDPETRTIRIEPS